MNNQVIVRLNTIEKVNQFTGIAMKFHSDIDVSIGSYTVDGKSTLGMMAFDLRKPLNVIIHSSDKEEIRKFYKEMAEFR